MFVLLGSEWLIGILYRPSTCVSRRWIKVGLTLVQRRRWCSNVEPTLIQRLLVSAECCCVCLWDRLTANSHTAGQLHRASDVASVHEAGPTFGQRCRIRPTINVRYEKCIAKVTCYA